MRKKILILIVVLVALFATNVNGQVQRGFWDWGPTVEISSNPMYAYLGGCIEMMIPRFGHAGSFGRASGTEKFILNRRVQTPFGEVRNKPWWDWVPRNFAVGFRGGYTPMTSVMGFEVALKYERQNWRLKMPGAEDYVNYSKQMLTPEASLNFSIGSMTSSFRLCLEPGVRYNLALSAKGDYNDKDYVNNGMTGLFGIGCNFLNTFKILIRYERDFFDFFNEDFVAPDGSKPYTGFSSSNSALMITLRANAR